MTFSWYTSEGLFIGALKNATTLVLAFGDNVLFTSVTVQSDGYNIRNPNAIFSNVRKLEFLLLLVSCADAFSGPCSAIKGHMQLIKDAKVIIRTGNVMVMEQIAFALIATHIVQVVLYQF
jgi:hypothetical protein